MGMTWLKSNWRLPVLNLFAVSVLVTILTQGSTDWRATDTFDPMLASGKWAIRFLIGCLAMTPLNTYFGWRESINLRKPAGLWAFGFASLHILLHIRQASFEWLTIDMPIYLILGLVGISILGALAATSNRWSMQRLGKNWKRLHRLVYLAGMAVATHGMLATMMSKKIHVRDPQAPQEIKIYIALLSVLLLVRLPFVRHWLTQMANLLKHSWRLKPQTSPVAIPGGGVELLNEIHGRESGVSIQPTLIIPNEMTEFSVWRRVHESSANIKKSPDDDRVDQPVESPLEVERES
jgi:methionine sulfoxide reductase heme-binding subunit